MTAIFTDTFKAALAVDPTLMDFAQVEMVMFPIAASLRPDQEVEGTAPISDSPYAAIDTIAGLEAQLGWGPSVPQTATLTLPAAATREGIPPLATYFAKMSNNIPFKLPALFPTSLVKAIAFTYKGPTSVAGAYVNFPGTVSNYLSTPEHTDLDITGDLTIVARVRATDWTPAATTTIVSKWAGSGQGSYRLEISPTSGGRAMFTHSIDGTTERGAMANAAFPGTDGQWLWIAVTFDVDAGGGNSQTRLWSGPDSGTGPDGVAWTQVGTNIALPGTTPIFNSTAPLTIGSHSAGASGRFSGDISYVSIRSGVGAGNTVGGTERFRYDAVADLLNVTPETTSFTASTGQTVTVHRSGSPSTLLVQSVPVTNKVMFVTDTPVSTGTVMRPGDGVIAQADPVKGRIFVSWATDSVIEGPLVREIAPPPFEPARTQHVWIYPMRTNMIANPSFEEDTDYWRSSGAKSQVVTKIACTVRAATVANLVALSGTMTVDTVALVAGDRVLVKNQPVITGLSPFGAQATPAMLPLNGLLPPDWDGPGRPAVALQMSPNEAMYYDNNSDVPRDGHLYQYVTTARSPTGWADLGLTAPVLPENNGVYVVAAGAWARAADANTPEELEDLVVYVRNGSQRATAWQCTAPVTPIVVGTTPLTFVQATTGGGGNFAGHFAGKVVESNMFPLISRYNEEGWTLQMRVRSDGEVKVGFITWGADFAATVADWGHREEVWLPNDGWLSVRTCRGIGEVFTGMLRVETQGTYIDLDLVCVEPGTMPANYADWPYFDGDALYATDHDYSWYERPHKSYSCWYDNRDAVLGRLFAWNVSSEDAAPGGVFTDEEAAIQGLAHQWIPAGTPLIYHIDVLYPEDPKRPLPPVTGSVLPYQVGSNPQGVVSPWVAREAIAGTPGTWGPVTWVAPSPLPPASVYDMQRNSVKPTPNTRWTPGQYVQTATLGIPGRAWWTGTQWFEGVAQA